MAVFIIFFFWTNYHKKCFLGNLHVRKKMYFKSINLYKEELFRKMLVFRRARKFRCIVMENSIFYFKIIVIASCTFFFLEYIKLLHILPYRISVKHVKLMQKFEAFFSCIIEYFLCIYYFISFLFSFYNDTRKTRTHCHLWLLLTD